MAKAKNAKPKRKPGRKKKLKTTQTALQKFEGSYTELREMMGGDDDATLFFIEWVTNGRNAKKAYKAIKPDVTDQSAKTLGARMLTRVDLSLVLDSYGIGVDTYMRKLKEGLEATRLYGKSAIEHPDYKARRAYHEVLGEMLGLENKKEQAVTFNFNTIGTVIQNARRERGLEE